VRLRIALDLDGVVYDWCASCALQLKRIGGYDFDPKAVNEWNWFEGRVDKKHWKQLWKTPWVESLFGDAMPFHGTKQFVAGLAQMEADLVVVTSRPRAVRRLTIERWFADFPSVMPVGFEFVNRGVEKDRAGCDVLIDDCLENVKAFSKFSILLDRPYNQTEALSDSDSAVRVFDYFNVLREVSFSIDEAKEAK
jgi:hypothetical protein